MMDAVPIMPETPQQSPFSFADRLRLPITLDAADLRTFAARSLARFKIPSSIHFVDQLPHSLTGMVSRARLRMLGLHLVAEETQHAEGVDG